MPQTACPIQDHIPSTLPEGLCSTGRCRAAAARPLLRAHMRSFLPWAAKKYFEARRREVALTVAVVEVLEDGGDSSSSIGAGWRWTCPRR